MTNSNKKPYKELTDLEKLNKCWKKFNGFMHRGEYSAAITRAATATEIAANIAIRYELQERRGLESEFVDHLLKWANGVAGKLVKLLKPLYKTNEQREIYRFLEERSKEINDRRNEVIHSGHYMNQAEAERIESLAKEFIEKLIVIYHEDFKLLNAHSSRKLEMN